MNERRQHTPGEIWLASVATGVGILGPPFEQQPNPSSQLNNQPAKAYAQPKQHRRPPPVSFQAAAAMSGPSTTSQPPRVESYSGPSGYQVSTSPARQQPPPPNAAPHQPSPPRGYTSSNVGAGPAPQPRYPPCPGSRLVYGWHWYGFPELTICAQCWESFAASTPLASLAPMRQVYIGDGRMCCLSPRLRRMWMDACTLGNDPTEMLQFARMRIDVWAATLSRAAYLRSTLMQEQINVGHFMLLSSMHRGMQSNKIITERTDGYLHGNGLLGWHQTDEGATGAGYERESREAQARANDPNTWQLIHELEWQWAQVE